MADQTPAARLARAAARIREVAERAFRAEEVLGVWDPRPYEDLQQMGFCGTTVALAVAAWLDLTAKDVAGLARPQDAEDYHYGAFAVADAVLGTNPQETT